MAASVGFGTQRAEDTWEQGQHKQRQVIAGIASQRRPPTGQGRPRKPAGPLHMGAAPSMLHVAHAAAHAVHAAHVESMQCYARAFVLSATSGAWKSRPSLGLKARNRPHFCSPAATRSSLPRQLATTCRQQGRYDKYLTFCSKLF